MINIKRINCERTGDSCKSCGRDKRLQYQILTFPPSKRNTTQFASAEIILCDDCLERLQKKIEKARS